MKFKTMLPLGLALFVAGGLGAQTPTPAAPVTPPAKTAPAPAAPKKKDDGKKKTEVKMGKIDGLEVARGQTFLGIQIVNGVFKLTNYDKMKKPVAADFTKVALRWTVNYQPNPERTLLTPSGGVGAFSSEKVVKPPYSFRLFVTLIKGDADDAPVENLTVEFHQ